VLGRGWSTTNETLVLPSSQLDDADSISTDEPQPLLSAHYHSETTAATAVEGEICFRDCDVDGRIFAVCLGNGSWAAVHSNGLWVPEYPARPPAVCSRPPPPPPPPHAVGGCPRGSYQARGRCIDCPAGYFQPSQGFRGGDCTLCPPGRYRNASLSASSCDICPAGRYWRERGAVACRTCPGGRYTPRAGGTGLINCSIVNADTGGMHFSLNVTTVPSPPPPPPPTRAPSAVPAVAAVPPDDEEEGDGEEDEDSAILVLWSWFAWAGGASRELFLGSCIIGCAGCRMCFRGCKKCKARALGQQQDRRGAHGGGGRRTLSRRERQQQRARAEIGQALHTVMQEPDDAPPLLNTRPQNRRALASLLGQQPMQHQQRGLGDEADGFGGGSGGGSINAAFAASDSEGAPAPLLATFVMDTPKPPSSYSYGGGQSYDTGMTGSSGGAGDRPLLLMAETTMNPSVIAGADAVVAAPVGAPAAPHGQRYFGLPRASGSGGSIGGGGGGSGEDPSGSI
jgi:hypothetical protein